MKSKSIILGATGSMGYAYTRELLDRGIETDILVRDQEKAKSLFQNNPLLTIHTGDVNNMEDLLAATAGKEEIFFGINYPYSKWEKYMIPITKNVISAASQDNSTILFPGNIYSFGNVPDPITEDTVPHPSTRKGRIRLKMEQMLEKASQQGKCRVINLRLSDFWGPNVANGLIKPIFGNAARGKAMYWLVRADIPHQFVYTPDAAKVFYLLSQQKDLPPYYTLNYGGHIVSDLSSFTRQISLIARSPNKLRLYSKTTLKVMGWIIPDIRELWENLYLFENSVLLDDRKFRSSTPEFQETGLEEAVQKTIDSYN